MPWKKWLILLCMDFILLNPSLDLPMWLLCACRLVSLIERVQPSIFLVSYNQYIAPPKKKILTNLWWLMLSVGARIPTTHVRGGAGTSPFSAKIELEPERGSKCISADRWWLLILRKPVLGQSEGDTLPYQVGKRISVRMFHYVTRMGQTRDTL